MVTSRGETEQCETRTYHKVTVVKVCSSRVDQPYFPKLCLTSKETIIDLYGGQIFGNKLGKHPRV